MEFTDYKCPICNKSFEKNDDVVVCPECGAPHHRECYEKEGHCFFENNHSDDFSFENSEDAQSSFEDNENYSIVTCKNCKTENPKENFYCYKCNAPLYDEDKKQNDYSRQQGDRQPNSQPFGNGNMPPFGMPFGQNTQNANPFDPMAGFKNDEPVAENITAGEMAKFVGKSTQYFLRIFSVFNKFKSSRFSFSAFIFSGFYFLYRKMIVIGAILSFLIIGLKVAEIYIMTLPSYQNAYNALLTAINSGQYTSLFNVQGMSQQDLFFALLPSLLEIVKLIIMVISGIIANKCYYNHCINRINDIKQNCDANDLNKTLEAKGGVNLPLAICVGVTYFAISYIPVFL